MQGSSPLTRGKLRLPINVCIMTGLIPAHAGKTRSGDRRPFRTPAHPRSRGENIQSPSQTVKTSGSSPLTRGKQTHATWLNILAGLIPAHAGKTRGQRRARDSDRAHPRSRGENSSEAGDEKGSTGSSPLTRGKR